VFECGVVGVGLVVDDNSQGLWIFGWFVLSVSDYCGPLVPFCSDDGVEICHYLVLSWLTGGFFGANNQASVTVRERSGVLDQG
jgi:hypothetical protein